MLIYIILVFLIILLPLLKVDKKKYCIIIGTAMTLIVGLRSVDMGLVDTKNVYVPIFTKLLDMSFLNSIKYIFDVEKTNILFYLLSKLILMAVGNIRILLFFISIPLNYTVSKIIYKYSKLPSMSFIMFFSLNYFAFSFTLLKHCIALALIISSFEYLKNNNLKKFLIMIFIAGLFHNTAWIFFIAYPIRKLKINFRNINVIIIFTIIIYFFGSNLFQVLIKLLGNNHYSDYINFGTNTLTFYFINLIILIFTMLIDEKNKSEEQIICLNLHTLGICFLSCMMIISEAFRIGTFFTIFSIISLPNALYSTKLIKNEYKSIVYVIFYIIFIMYFFKFTIYNNNIYPYIIGNWSC